MLGYRQNSGRIGKTAFDRVLTTVRGGRHFQNRQFHSPNCELQPKTMHHLERGLVGNPLAELGSQTYDNLGAKAVVSGAREDLCERSARSSDLAGLFGCACTHASFQAWGRILSVCPRIGPERLGTAPAAKFPSPLDRSMDMITNAFMASCRPMPPSCASCLLPVQGRQHPPPNKR